MEISLPLAYQMYKKLIFVFLLIAASYCKKEGVGIDCSRLNGGVINLNSIVVKPVIDELTGDLNAKDGIGQKANLDILASRLNSHCSNLNATVICYACLYSNPPQSIIRVKADSAGVSVTRTILIMTPSDGTLKWGSIQK